MRRAVYLVLMATLAGTPAWTLAPPAETSGQLDASPALFAVLTAANAAGYDAEANSPTNNPLRKKIREHFAGQTLASLDELRRYFRDHRPKNDPNRELSQYISWALTTNGPPDFAPLHQGVPLPPDAAGLDDLAPFLAAFYKEAHLEDLWNQVQPAYDEAIAPYTAPVSRAVLQVNSYLRNPSSGYLGRKFQIYVDLLGAPNQVQTRSYVDDSYVVVTPSVELPIAGIRHAYLHYLLDPLGIKFSAALNKKERLRYYAEDAPLLSPVYKTDFVLLATESFIKAVESRMDHSPAAAERALREGYVLTPAFAELLPVYEAQDVALRLYFPDLVAAIDLKREDRRLENVAFATEAAVHTVRAAEEIAPPELTGAARTLDQAEQAYSARDLPRARGIYLRALEETGEPSLHAKAYYGLARIAILERDPETGDRLLRKALELEPDASTKSWSLLYLGKLADSQGEKNEAAERYQAALAVSGAPETVRGEAQKGLAGVFSKKSN